MVSVVEAANLPIRRARLIVRPLGERGEHVVKDPNTEAYFHLGPQEAFLLLCLDGELSVNQIRAQFEAKFGEELSEDDLTGFLELANDSGFVEYASSQPAAAPAQITYRQSILYWRRSLFDPDRMFNWLEPKIRFIWTRGFLVASSALIVFSFFVLWSNRQDLTSQFAKAFIWQTFVVVWITLVTATTLHEFAHGLTCKHYGGQVREVGFFLIYFLPAFYCNVSDAWLFREKSKRLWVTLAGGYCDLIVWSAAALIWRVTLADTLINYLAWVVLSVSGVRIFFNFNPLLKLDGYYLLSDWTNIPNLRQRSWDRLMAWIRWALWGAPLPGEEERSAFLLSFGAASWSYSVLFLLALFAWLIWRMGSAWGRGGALIGAAMGIVVMRSQFYGILGGEVRKMISTRRYRVLAWLVGILVVCAALAWVPIEQRASGSFVLRAVERAELRAPVSGFLRQAQFDEGDSVKRGDVVLKIDVPDLPMLIAQKQAQIAESEARMRMYQYGASRVRSLSPSEEAGIRRAEVEAEQAKLAALRHEQAYLQQRLAKLSVTTPVDGMISTARLRQQLGKYFNEGDLICVVENPNELEAEILVSEQEATRVRAGQTVQLHPRATVFRTLDARVHRVAPAATTQPVQSVVSVYCRISDGELRPEMTGYARISCGKRAAGAVAGEQVMRLLRTEFWW